MEDTHPRGCFLRVGDGHDVISLVGSNKGFINVEHPVEAEVWTDIPPKYYFHPSCKEAFVETAIVSGLGSDFDTILVRVHA